MTATSQSSLPTLEIVEPTPNPYVNILLYGPPKSGKTVGAASAPQKLLYLNADTGAATRFAHTLHTFDEVRVTGLQTLIDATQVLEDGGYETVALDPVADVYRVLLEEASGYALQPKIQQYGDAGTHLERFCRKLCELPVNAVFVAHDQTVPNEETGGMEHLPFVSTKSGSPVFAAKLLAMVDVIGYTGVAGDSDEPPKYMATLVNARGRRGGDRFGGALGTSRETNLSEWIETARKSTAPTAQKKEAA